MLTAGNEEGGNRMTRRGVLGAGLAGAAVAAGASTPGIAQAEQQTVRFRKIVDLTHTAFPTFPNFFGLSLEVTPILTVEEDGVFVNRLTLPEHFGTHWDAPAHFVADLLAAMQACASPGFGLFTGFPCRSRRASSIRRETAWLCGSLI